MPAPGAAPGAAERGADAAVVWVEGPAAAAAGAAAVWGRPGRVLALDVASLARDALAGEFFPREQLWKDQVGSVPLFQILL